MKMLRKCHNNEAQPSRVMKRRHVEKSGRNKDKMTPHMKPQTHSQRRTTTEESPCYGYYEITLGWGGGGGGGGRVALEPVLIARNLSLNSDAAPNYKFGFGQHRGILPHL